MERVFYRYSPTMRNNTSAILTLKTEDDSVIEVEVCREDMEFKELCQATYAELLKVMDVANKVFLYWGDACHSFAQINGLNSVNIKDIFYATSIHAGQGRVCEILGISTMDNDCKELDHILKTEAILNSVTYLDREYLYAVDPTRLVDKYYVDRYAPVFEKLIDMQIVDNNFVNFLDSVPPEFNRVFKTIAFNKWYKRRLEYLIKETDLDFISEDSSLYRAVIEYRETGKILMLQLTEDESLQKNEPTIYLLRTRAREQYENSRILSSKQRRARAQQSLRFIIPKTSVTPLVEV